MLSSSDEPPSSIAFIVRTISANSMVYQAWICRQASREIGSASSARAALPWCSRVWQWCS